MKPDPSRRQLKDAQGRLFWIWAFSIPVVLIMIASVAFGSPWPSPQIRNLGYLVLAVPVLFVVGRDELRATSVRPDGSHSISGLVVAAMAVGGYLSGLLALVAPVPNLAGIAVLVMAAYSTMCYLQKRPGRTSKNPVRD